MKNILTSVFIAIFVSGVVLAGTITRPYSSSDYAGGAKAVGSKVNTEFDTIVNWLNGANIASNNITALGISTSNIAAGAVTRPKLEALGESAVTISNVSTTTTSAQAIAGLSRTITTTGRPVFISLQAESITIGAQNSTSSEKVDAILYIQRNGVTIRQFRMNFNKQTAETNISFSVPLSLIHVDTGASAGSNTWTVHMQILGPSSTNGQLAIGNAGTAPSLMVFEL